MLCDLCDGEILPGQAQVEHGDGTGQRFAHEWCYNVEARVAALEAALRDATALIGERLFCDVCEGYAHECGCIPSVADRKRAPFFALLSAAPAQPAQEETPRCCKTCGADLAVQASNHGVPLDPMAVYCGPECDPAERADAEGGEHA